MKVISFFDQFVLEMREKSKDPAPEVLVNVWENIDGEMRLTDQKPLQRSQYDTRRQDLPLFLTHDSYNYI